MSNIAGITLYFKIRKILPLGKARGVDCCGLFRIMWVEMAGKTQANGILHPVFGPQGCFLSGQFFRSKNHKDDFGQLVVSYAVGFSTFPIKKTDRKKSTHHLVDIFGKTDWMALSVFTLLSSRKFKENNSSLPVVLVQEHAWISWPSWPSDGQGQLRCRSSDSLFHTCRVDDHHTLRDIHEYRTLLAKTAVEH